MAKDRDFLIMAKEITDDLISLRRAFHLIREKEPGCMAIMNAVTG
jgi:hypothetical protein